MNWNTRERLIIEALVLFSKNGFYGTSLNDVASKLDISKQALLHHFKTKEKLYAAVLEHASVHLMTELDKACSTQQSPREQLLTIFTQMSEPNDTDMHIVVLLMRELLDNRERANKVRQWFLRPYLNKLVALVEEAQKEGQFSGLPALAFIYQLIGATQYYLVSQPTLERLYTKQEYEQHRKAHMDLINRLLNL